MPQMFPLKWLTLYIMFSSLYLGFSAIIYFNKPSPHPNMYPTKTIKTPSHSWKW